MVSPTDITSKVARGNDQNARQLAYNGGPSILPPYLSAFFSVRGLATPTPPQRSAATTILELLHAWAFSGFESHLVSKHWNTPV